jgi:DNA adenine methylase
LHQNERLSHDQTILRNRICHGGILAAGSGLLKNGENGRGIHSRWYPQTIARRIHDIQTVKDTIRFVHGDAFALIDSYIGRKSACIFLDPPYTAGGKRAGTRLYTHFDIDHKRLFELASSLRGEFLMTYDVASEVAELALEHGLDIVEIPMKNTHHARMTELLVGKDLGWARF